MLKAIGARTDLSTSGQKWGRALLSGGLMAILSHSGMMLDLKPFALAFFAAGLMAGENAAALLLGLFAGSFCRDLSQIDLLLPIGCAMTLLLLLLTDRFRVAGRVSAEALVSALSGVGVLLPGLYRSGGQVFEAALALLSAIIAAASAPAFLAALRLTPARKHLMQEERLAVALLSVAALIGLNALWPAGAVGLAGLMTLTMAANAGSGALAGAAAGLALMIGGAPPIRAVSLAAAGAAAGVLAARGKNWSAPGFVLCGGLAGLYDFSHSPGPVPFAVAAVAYLIIPERAVVRLRGWMRAARDHPCDPDALARRLRAETEHKLRALSEAFGELSEGYKLPIDMPDEQALISEMRARLCEGCGSYGDCWAGEDNRAVRLLCQLISEAIDPDPGGMLSTGEIPPDIKRVCRRGESIPQRLRPMLQEFALVRRTELKRAGANQLVSAQFLQAQALLQGMADRQMRPLRVRDEAARRAMAALDRAGVPVRDAMALRGEQPEIVMTLSEGRWTREQAELAEESLSEELGGRYIAEPAQEDFPAEKRFIRLPKYAANWGVSCLSLEPGVPSGDSHLIRTLPGGRLLIALSDGMGTGEAARRESAQTVRLLWQFLLAEVDRDLALNTVNELMLGKSGEDMFATVDLCLIDLNTGRAEFSKLAASRSLILRNGEVRAVDGGRLPLGILEKVRPSVEEVELNPGDLLLMGTDGIMDVEEGVVESAIKNNTTLSPAELAECVVREVDKKTDQSRMDDRTVVCVRISKRRARGP